MFSFALFFLLIAVSVLGFDIDSKTNVAVYWGQASAGSQESLATYCQSDDVDIVLLSFLYVFPDPLSLDFSSACSDTFSDGLLHCSQIGEDIKTCQGLGKKVLLSLGGASGSYGFANDSEAETFAETLWNTFGGGSADERPFDDAIVDGFDFDIENSQPTGYAALVTKLREYFESGSKDYYISAAPQCYYPDASVGDLLQNSKVDFAFIQFYNNYCDVDRQFNWDTWLDFAETISPNTDIKLYLGLPGASTAASYGYISDLSLIESTVKNISTSSNFGGIMLWDASQGFTNQIDGETYVAQMKSILEQYASSEVSSTVSTTSTSSSSSIASLTSATSLTASSTSSSSISSSQTTSSIISSSTSIVTSAIPSSTSTSTSLTLSSSTLSTASSASSLPVTSTETSISSSLSISSTALSSTTVHSTSPTGASTYSPSSSEIISSSHILSTTSDSSTSSDFPSSLPTTTAVTTPTTTLSTKLLSSGSTGSSSSSAIITSSSSVPIEATTTFSEERSTTTLVPTSTLSSSSSVPSPTATSWAHSRAIALNEQFAAGDLNGKTTCFDGEISCTADGKIAICNYGDWVYTECAAGTTCFAYDTADVVSISCNFSGLKSDFE
ncbi:LAFE_0C07976g1_1 [Lachancea fermentati]|uniref:chitinase n=1 Tax=Lachancea fermentati TaxID=4955 RepID=A0A1G4M9Q8_LACFM|nr:LAFE_0C07976g1_1 [Lachancea fermentati]